MERPPSALRADFQFEWAKKRFLDDHYGLTRYTCRLHLPGLGPGVDTGRAEFRGAGCSTVVSSNMRAYCGSSSSWTFVKWTFLIRLNLRWYYIIHTDCGQTSQAVCVPNERTSSLPQNLKGKLEKIAHFVSVGSFLLQSHNKILLLENLNFIQFFWFWNFS